MSCYRISASGHTILNLFDVRSAPRQYVEVSQARQEKRTGSPLWEVVIPPMPKPPSVCKCMNIGVAGEMKKLMKANPNVEIRLRLGPQAKIVWEVWEGARHRRPSIHRLECECAHTNTIFTSTCNLDILRIVTKEPTDFLWSRESDVRYAIVYMFSNWCSQHMKESQ